MKYNVLGLMSGTSIDGLDCCLSQISIDEKYNFNYRIIDYKTYPYNQNTKDIIMKALNLKKVDINVADTYLGKLFLEYSKNFINDRKIDLIGSHGQTILHRDMISTLQIGNPKFLKSYFKVPTIFNFRENDVICKGNGAPLVPFLDWLLFKDYTNDIILLNLGGISNVTFINKKGKRSDVIGFDTGPGMCMIDNYVKKIWNNPMDINGKYSKKGKINYSILDKLMSHSFIKKTPPKSACTSIFDIDIIFDDIFLQLTEFPEDLLRTLVKFTSKSISYNINKFIKFDNDCDLIISGGGYHHPMLKSELLKDLGLNEVNLYSLKQIGVDCKEAFLISVLAVTKFLSITSNMPSVTGSTKEVVLGEEFII